MINIKIDSRKVTKGDTFVALRGTNVDGHDFIDKAIENGATKVIIEQEIECNIEKVIVEDTNKWLTDYISNTYSKEINEMKETDNDEDLLIKADKALYQAKNTGRNKVVVQYE